MRGADDPETLNSSHVVPEQETARQAEEALREAAFDDVLLKHMERCWIAQCEIAARLTSKVNVFVSVLALLFGLGLFKIEWTYDPKHSSRINPVWLLWSVKAALCLALGAFGWGLYAGLRRTSRDSDVPEFASDYLLLPDESTANPPATEQESRATVFYRYSEALDDLRRQNRQKARKVAQCEGGFTVGIVLVLAAIVAYIMGGYPPIREVNDVATSTATTLPAGTQPASRPAPVGP